MFNPDQYDLLGAGGDFIKVSGKFKCVVDGVEMVAVKGNQSAFYLQVTFRITEGEQKDQKFVDRLNLSNPNQTTREIAWKKLASLAHATGVQNATSDARVYVGRPLQIYVVAEEQTSTTDPNKTVWNNECKEYFYADGQTLVKGRYGSATAGAQTQGYAQPNAPAPQQQQQFTPNAPTAAPAPQPQVQQPQTQYVDPNQQQQQPQISTNIQPQFTHEQPAQQQQVQQPQVQQQQVQQPQYQEQQQQPQQQFQNTVPAGATGGFTPPPMPQFTPQS